jgi:hypothetical protein
MVYFKLKFCRTLIVLSDWNSFKEQKFAAICPWKVISLTSDLMLFLLYFRTV